MLDEAIKDEATNAGHDCTTIGRSGTLSLALAQGWRMAVFQ